MVNRKKPMLTATIDQKVYDEIMDSQVIFMRFRRILIIVI